jgi:hypothetical protein
MSPHISNECGADCEAVVHQWASKVQIPVLDAQLLVHAHHLLFVAYREGKWFRRAENRIGRHVNFNVSGGHFGVSSAVGTHRDFAGDAQTRFRAKFGAVRKNGRIKEKLNDPGSVAKVDKKQTAEVAHSVRPAVEGYSLPGVRGAQFTAIVGALDKAHEPRSLPFEPFSGFDR